MKLNYMLGIGIVLSLVGFSLLLAFGFLYVGPYMSVRGFKATECSTTFSSAGSTLYAQFVPCECAADGSSSCTSQYPCVWIRVNFSIESGSDDQQNILITNQTLYDSYETYFLQHDVAQCSYHKCNRMSKINIESTRAFFDRYSTNTSYRCYYDPTKPTFAILEVVGLATVVNCIFWPSLAFLIGIVIFFVQIFHVDSSSSSSSHKNQISSLERQWARIRERSYGRMTSTGSERLVKADGIERAASHNTVCLQN